ncbi:MAG: hypothetical protein ACJAZ2_001575, partial [Glaciecola sp.]
RKNDRFPLCIEREARRKGQDLPKKNGRIVFRLLKEKKENSGRAPKDEPQAD